VTWVYISLMVFAVWAFALTVWLFMRSIDADMLKERLDNHRDAIGDTTRDTRSKLGYTSCRLDTLESRVDALAREVSPPPPPVKFKIDFAKVTKGLQDSIDTLEKIKKQVKA